MSTRHPIDVESLLLHDDFVRGLARSLLGRDARAEDVAQDAWLAAAQGGPQSRVTARGWLGQVVRNRVASLRRKDRSARRWREKQPRSSDVPGAAVILGREEMRGHVVEALLGLEPMYRECLVLKFYEGRKPREIAKQLDVPVETVRTRTRRGLEQMRRALDGSYGDRRRWTAALLPWAAVPDVSVPFLPLAVVVLGVAAVLVLLIWTPESDDHDGWSGETTTTESEGPFLVGRNASDRRPQQALPDGDGAAEDPPPWRVVGTMRWNTGRKPAAGVRVEARVISGRKTMAVLGETRTASDGTYELSMSGLRELSPATLAASVLFLSTPGTTNGRWPPGREIPLRAFKAGERQQVLRSDWIVYGPEDGQGHVGGRLVDPDGEPVIDGTVGLYRGTPGDHTLVKAGSLNEVGDFDVPAGSSTYYSGGSGIQEPETLTLIATGSGSGRLVVPGVRVHPKEDLWLGKLQLEPGEHIIRLRLELENGEPLAGIVVAAMSGSWHALSKDKRHYGPGAHNDKTIVRTTSDDGSYELHANEGGPWCLWVDPRRSHRGNQEDPGQVPPTIEVLADGHDGIAQVVTVPGSLLRIQLSDETGRPAAGVQWNAVGWPAERHRACQTAWESVGRALQDRDFAYIGDENAPEWSMQDDARMDVGDSLSTLDEIRILAPEGSHWILNAWTLGLYAGQARFEVPPLERAGAAQLVLKPIRPASFEIKTTYQGQAVKARFNYFYHLSGTDGVDGRGTLLSGQQLRELAPGSYGLRLRCETHHIEKYHHWVNIKPGQHYELELEASPGGCLHIDIEAPRRPFSTHPLRAYLHIRPVGAQQSLVRHQFLVTPTEDGGVFARLSVAPHRNRVPFLLEPGRYAVHLTAKGYGTQPVEVDIRTEQVSTVRLALQEKP